MVEELDKQSDQGQFHFTHNFNQSMERLWSDIVRRRAKVYDTTREVGGIKPDGTAEVLSLNDPENKDSLMMTSGDLGVEISVGAAMQAQTEDERRLAEILAQDPNVMAKAGDLVVKLGSHGGPTIDQIAERLKPAGLQDGETSPEQLQQQLAMQGQQIEQLNAQLQEAGKIIQTKQIEAQNRLAVAEKQASASIEVARINAAAKGAAQDAELSADLIKQATDIDASADEAEAGRVAQAEQDEVSRQHDLTKQAGQQGHELVKQTAEQKHALQMKPLDKAKETGE